MNPHCHTTLVANSDQTRISRSQARAFSMFRLERLLDGKDPILRVLIWGKLIFRARELAEFGDSLLQLLEGLVVCE